MLVTAQRTTEPAAVPPPGRLLAIVSARFVAAWLTANVVGGKLFVVAESVLLRESRKKAR